MGKEITSPVQRQLRKVRRRLVAQALLCQLAWCWIGGLTLLVLWSLVHPLFFEPMSASVRAAVMACVLGIATAAALVLAWIGAPSRLTAALALDEKFGLRERVTTTLSLTPGEADTPAGQALLADANARVAALPIRSRFPLRLPWSAALVPVVAGALALVVNYYEPVLGNRDASVQANPRQTSNPDEIANKFAELKEAAKKKWPKEEQAAARDPELMKAWEKLLQQPLDAKNKDQVRERLEAMKPIDELLNDRMADLKAQADKNKHLSEHLKQFGKEEDGSRREPKDGPGKELEEALAKGDLNKVEKELKRLADQMAKNELNDQERKQLEDRLREIQRRLEQIADLKDLKDRLRAAQEAGKITKEQLNEALKQLKADAAELKELQALADKLRECEACMQGGDGKKAADQLAKAAAALANLDPDGKKLKALLAEQKLLQDARQAMCQGLFGQDGMGQGKQPGTLRPVGKDKETGAKNERQHAEKDPRGALVIQGYGKGGTFDPIPAQEVGGVFRRVAQDAREAIEQQRVPPGTEEFLQGYFNKLGGQK